MPCSNQPEGLATSDEETCCAVSEVKVEGEGCTHITEQKAAEAMAEAAVRQGKSGLHEQDAGGPQEQKESKGGRLIKPCHGRPRQSPSDTDTVLQEARQQRY